MSKKLYQALRTQKETTQQVPQEIYGTLFAIEGFVEVKDRPSFVYVQLRDNQNEIIQAFNNKVATSPNLPVIVTREGNRYVIQGVNTQRYQNNWNNNAPYLPLHGTVHSFADGAGGDVAWIYSRQFMPNLVYPNSGGITGTSAYIAPHVLLDANRVWRYVGATGTDNLLNYKGTGSSSAMLLIYINATNGNPGILVGSGSYFPNNLTGTATIFPYIPIPDPATQIPLAAVRMDTGTSSITWDNLYDVRQWLHAMPSGTSSGGGGGGVDTIGFVGQNKGIYLATGTVLNVNGSRLTLSASGTVFNLTNSPDPQSQIGIYGLTSGTPIGTGTSMNFVYPIYASMSGTTIHVQSGAGAETNVNDIFRCDNPGGVSAFVGTIATLPGGAVLTYNVSSGQEGAMVPQSTSTLAKMRLYNTTRGTYALISNCVTGTNTVTLTANVPAGWVVGDTITIASQTVSGGSTSWVDMEILSGPINKNDVWFVLGIVSATAGDVLRAHQLTTFATSRIKQVLAQATNISNEVPRLFIVTANVFSIGWTGTPTIVYIREEGFMK